MAMLKFQRDCDERVGLEMFEPWHLSFICESVETALLNLQSRLIFRDWQGVGMV
jgi:hypothetical protein